MSLDFKNEPNFSFSEYIEIASLKSAEIMALSLQIGPILIGACIAEQKILYDAGKNFGLSIYLKNEWSKFFNNDNYEKCESAFLFYKAIELANAGQKHILIKGFKNQFSKPDEIRKLFDKLEVKEETEEIIKAFFDSAISQLDSLNIDKGRRDKFIQILNSSYLGDFN